MDDVNVSTIDGFRAAMLGVLEEWLPKGYGQDPRMTIYNVVPGINYLTADVHDEDGMHLKSFRCTLLVTEIPPGVSDATANGAEMPVEGLEMYVDPGQGSQPPVVPEENDPVVHLGLLGAPSRMPVINAATAVKSWQQLESLKAADRPRWERVWPRFLDLCWKLPDAELSRLPTRLYQMMVDHDELRNTHGGG